MTSSPESTRNLGMIVNYEMQSRHGGMKWYEISILLSVLSYQCIRPNVLVQHGRGSRTSPLAFRNSQGMSKRER